MIIEGRTWLFPEANINTDLMMPAALFRMPAAEQPKQLFAVYRPGWAASVQPGDIIVGGRNFGTGSSRPAPSLMAGLGIKAVIAESLNGLFFRNCINAGIAASECAGILDIVDEADVVSLDPASGAIVDTRTGATAHGSALPDTLIELLADGGLLRRLERGGYLKPRIRSA
ncbi:MAG: 3-isopropylmalate dehydratase [Ilumatobacteraceae bacterium]